MKTNYKNYVFSAVFVLFCLLQSQAQAIVINAPEPADNPNLSGNSPWNAICAGNGGFNEYFVNISWAGTVNAGNEFILELSDAQGNFGSPSILKTITDKNTTTDFDISFAIPETTRGQGYKMRVRSTDPVKTGSASDAYNMYYLDVTTNLNISQAGDGVPPGSVCSPDPITLQVDNITNPETYQYIWYRSGTLLTGETGHTLNVTQSGMYNAFVDYGPVCTGSGNTDSNIVDVTIGTAGEGIAVANPTRTALCRTDTETLSIDRTDATWNYRWYKDGNPIPGAVASSFNVNGANVGFEGEYAVEISGNSICTERSAPITITNAEVYTVTRDNPENIVVLPSQTQTLSISTTANAPTYKWFKDGAEISGETNATLEITQAGDYYAEVTQTGGTCGLSSKNSEVTRAVAPASFEIIAGYQDTYTSCESTSTVLEVTTINAVASDGTKTDVTTDLADTFSYQWEKDGATVSGETNKIISLASDAENGEYKVNAILDSYNEDSNVLSVKLLTSETVLIESNSTTYCSASDIVTITTDKDLSAESFEWQRDGVPVGTTGQSLDVNATGTYRLVLDKNGCSLISNEITIVPFDEDSITLNVEEEVVIPEGTSLTVRAQGGTAYSWMNANNEEMSNTDSVTITEEGTYTLVARVDNCEVVKQVSVTYLDSFQVPNVITVNGDGINDQWIIPNSFSNKADVNVIIYNEQGEEVLNEFDYKNNWPQSSTAFTRQNMVFYYKIRDASEVLKQGTITVIR
ncbi:gliding motility-associated C-terminal domain-containing protein [Maribacter sp. 2210JD10-5]|uniref:T9SS type B sorting domain-containing protein n=1 Tax=Maribacter sp. 2210JD10-5 TaxID=3386272 RepID=UPI0039BD6E8C